MTRAPRLQRVAPLFAVAALVVPDVAVTQTFRAGADAVRVDVLVTDGRRPVVGLETADFELSDNGIVQTIDAVDVESAPITLMMVLDISDSVDGEPLDHLRDAVEAADETLSPGDRLSLVTFSDRLALRANLSVNRDLVRKVVNDVEAGGATALYDATLAALLLRPRSEGRMVMLVFSDGGDTISWVDPRSVISTAQRSDVVIYAVTLRRQVEQQNPGDVRRNQLERQWFREAPENFGRPFLPFLVAETGGSVLVAERADRLRDTVAKIVNEFKSRYVLSYAPRGVEPGGWHAIDVRLKNKRGDVTARRGYLRGPS